MILLCRLDRGLFLLVSVIAQLLLLSAVAAGFFQVVARFVLQSPADWSEAWTRASLIWAVMLGVALAFRQGAMLSVELLHSLLKGRARRGLETLVLLIVTGFLGFLTWVGAQMVWRVRFQTMPRLEISISWIYLAIPVGAGLAFIAVVAWWLQAAPRPIIDETVI